YNYINIQTMVGSKIQQGSAHANITKKDAQVVTEQNKDDLLEVIYRIAGGQFSKVILLEKVKILFYHWDNDTFSDTAQALVDDNLIVLQGRMEHAALT